MLCTCSKPFARNEWKGPLGQRLAGPMNIGAVDLPRANRLAKAVEHLAIALSDRNEHGFRALRKAEAPIPLNEASCPRQVLSSAAAHDARDGYGQPRWGFIRRILLCGSGQHGKPLLPLDRTEMGP
jgi:hypothetical protein